MTAGDLDFRLPADGDDASLIRVTRRDWEKARMLLLEALDERGEHGPGDKA